jgi:lipopolysaccharide assembly protein B
MIDDLQWLLLALPVTFALGWMAARMDLRQLKRDQRENPKAYFKGLSLLLNEQQDKAIDAFIEAVQNDPDTAELHFALGNLFRRRGEFERAVRVHEHLLARADLKPEERDRAQRALAQDFMRAGLFDRAEAAWHKLEGTGFDAEARLALLSLHERSRDWSRAQEMASVLESRGVGSFASRLAHYHCELAQEADKRKDDAAADLALERAIAAAPHAARPRIVQGQRLSRQGKPVQAMASWEAVLEAAPASFGLVAEDYAKAALSTENDSVSKRAQATLQSAYDKTPSMAVVKALMSLEPVEEQRQQLLQNHARTHPSLSAAQALLAQTEGLDKTEALSSIRQAVDRAARPLQRYRCAACGFEAQHWFWQCPGCQGWDSFPPQPIEEL